MDWWIYKQLRSQILTDLRKYVPDGYFSREINELTASNTIIGSKYFTDELKWGYHATNLGRTLFFEPDASLTARQTAASEVLMNLGLLAGFDAYYKLLLKFIEISKGQEEDSINISDAVIQLEKQQLPTSKNNIHQSLNRYLHYLSDQEAKPFKFLLKDSHQKQSVQQDNDINPWDTLDPRDPDPKQPWYTPARYFSRQLVRDDPTLLTKRDILVAKVVQSLTNAGIKKRGGINPFSPGTIKKALSNVSLG